MDSTTDNAHKLSSNLGRLLLEFGKDYERRILEKLHRRGHPLVRPSHTAVFFNLGLGAVRVTELAERAQVTQQAMGKILKELERIGYVARDIDGSDRRAKKIRLTERGRDLINDTTEVVAEVRGYYADQVGARELEDLEAQLALCINRIGLDYLPDSWADPSQAA